MRWNSPAGLGEGQIAQFVEDDEVEADEIVSQTPLTAAAGLAFQPVDQVDDGVEPAPGSAADAGPRDGNGEMAALRCWARKVPVASSRTSASLIGVPLNRGAHAIQLDRPIRSKTSARSIS